MFSSHFSQAFLIGVLAFLFALQVEGVSIERPKMNGKPDYAVFAGAFHLKEHLRLTIPKLERAGYRTHSETLSTVNNAAKTVSDDVDQIRGVLNPLFDQGKDVVLMIHSYAGIPGSAAIKGLSKPERAAQGKKGGLIGVVYLCAFVAPEGKSLKDMIGGDFTPWQRPDSQKGLLFVDDPAPIFYNDVKEPILSEAVRIFKPHSIKAIEAKSPPVGYTDAAYKGRLAYIRGEFDQAIPAFAQDDMIAKSGAEFIVERFATGHSSFLSHPELLVSTLDKLAMQFKAVP